MPDTSAMVSLENLHVSLTAHGGLVHILRGISLRIARGETIGLIGPSGSGKSTLLMVLAGLEMTFEGGVIVANADYAHMDEDARALHRRDNIGIIFQSFHLIASMTALENVALPLELAGWGGDAAVRATEMLDEVGLAHRRAHYPSELSGGEQQRVAIARALIHAPPLILADEPTGNLDQKTGEQIMDLLFTLVSERNATLFLITHAHELAAKCKRQIIMRDGQVIE